VPIRTKFGMVTHETVLRRISRGQPDLHPKRRGLYVTAEFLAVIRLSKLLKRSES